METPETVFTRHARKLGFLRVGFSPAETPPYVAAFQDWIAAGRHADMDWLARHADLRRHPSNLLRGCNTVISLAYPYSARKPATPEGFETARFTQPRCEDYHQRLKKLARLLLEVLRSLDPHSRNRVCVDSAPLLERSFALRAGLGFIGKNNLLIIPGHGSYVLLAEILTTILFSPSVAAPMENRCGDCNRCLTGCPSGALQRAHLLDARRCLSYRTIEQAGPVDRETAALMGSCFFGCDVCQEMCPFNAAPSRKDPCLPPVSEILAMDSASFDRVFGKSAFCRTGLPKLKENLHAVMEQCSGDSG